MPKTDIERAREYGIASAEGNYKEFSEEASLRGEKFSWEHSIVGLARIAAAGLYNAFRTEKSEKKMTSLKKVAYEACVARWQELCKRDQRY